MVGDLDNSFWNIGNSGMSGMLRMSGETDRHQVSYIFRTTSLYDLNDDGNFRKFWNFGNVRNVKNFRNVRTDIKCYTFLEPPPRADLNDDGNFKNGGNFRNVRNDRNGENVRNVSTYIKCHNFSDTQA